MGLRPGDPGYMDAFRNALKSYRETHTVCRAPRCQWGHVPKVPEVIDTYTGEPATEPCKECNGDGFVHIQPRLI